MRDKAVPTLLIENFQSPPSLANIPEKASLVDRSKGILKINSQPFNYLLNS